MHSADERKGARIEAGHTTMIYANEIFSLRSHPALGSFRKTVLRHGRLSPLPSEERDEGRAKRTRNDVGMMNHVRERLERSLPPRFLMPLPFHPYSPRPRFLSARIYRQMYQFRVFVFSDGRPIVHRTSRPPNADRGI